MLNMNFLGRYDSNDVYVYTHTLYEVRHPGVRSEEVLFSL